MKILLRIIAESTAQAFQQLVANRLRSFLSLLGVSIGIFCIVGVQSAVDSLEDNVRGSIEKLGDDVVYVQKISWSEDPGQNFYKYMRRPNVNYDDFRVVQERVKSASLTAFSVGIGVRTVKYLSNSFNQGQYVAISNDFGELFKFDFEKGRYFSPSEFQFGANKALIGHKVAETLFGTIEPIGKEIKINGKKLEVIGVLKQEGDNLVSVFPYDDCVIIPYELARKIANLKPNHPFGNSSISVKVREGYEIAQLRDELTGILRAHRRLKPKQENNFSLNELSIISGFLTSFFNVLNMLGIVVGGFAIFVGMFSVANIMFVSVKERTNIIGIKKALGAKRYVILLEFLIEASILCLIGGIVGLALVWIATTILSQLISFKIYLSVGNVIFGVALSIVVGIIAGMIPASQAARMDPVEAMRAK